MLSTSYEALYALDALRSRSNLNKNQIALLIEIDPAQYRTGVNRMRVGEKVGLNGPIDIKVRFGIAILIYGLGKGHLPLIAGKTADIKAGQKLTIAKMEDEFLSNYDERKLDNDPTGFIEAQREGREQSIPTQMLIDHAQKFSGLLN